MAIPLGTVVNFSHPEEPKSLEETWLLCDGTLKEASKFEELFTLLGGAFGGDSNKTFNVPDLRGQFVRGTDNSPINKAARRDPDAATRTAMNKGGNIGNAVGSVQGDSVQPHDHNLENTWGTDAPDSGDGEVLVKANNPPGGAIIGTTLLSDGEDVRPENAALSFIILAGEPKQRLPLGSVIMYAGSNDPEDRTKDGDVWMICDGRPLERKDYPEFYKTFKDVLGTTDPQSRWFNLPDFRGIFLRGADAGTGRDPDMKSRTPMFKGGKGGAEIGSMQTSQLGPHKHGLAGAIQILHHGGTIRQAMGAPGRGDSAGATNIEGTGIGKETRPTNAYLHYAIRLQ
jgi:microcystin-dependent protein